MITILSPGDAGEHAPCGCHAAWMGDSPHRCGAADGPKEKTTGNSGGLAIRGDIIDLSGGGGLERSLLIVFWVIRPNGTGGLIILPPEVSGDNPSWLLAWGTYRGHLIAIVIGVGG